MISIFGLKVWQHISRPRTIYYLNLKAYAEKGNSFVFQSDSLLCKAYFSKPFCTFL